VTVPAAVQVAVALLAVTRRTLSGRDGDVISTFGPASLVEFGLFWLDGDVLGWNCEGNRLAATIVVDEALTGQRREVVVHDAVVHRLERQISYTDVTTIHLRRPYGGCHEFEFLDSLSTRRQVVKDCCAWLLEGGGSVVLGIDAVGHASFPSTVITIGPRLVEGSRR
jgi:hypothetical protein